jgi:peptidoglycan/LPS O-acetylase OafA/YrhL
MPRQWLPKPLLYLGKISYGLYVFHVLALGCVREAIARIGNSSFGSGSAVWTAVSYLLVLAGGLTVTILLAMASYRFLELPFLKLKERFTFVESRRA